MSVHSKGKGGGRSYCLLIAFWLSGNFLMNTPALAQTVTVLKGATVIDGTGAQPKPNTTVVVAGERILWVGPSEEYRSPRGAKVIDASGKNLLPGFIDMHAHVAFGPVEKTSSLTAPFRMVYDDSASQQMVTTLPRFGITTIRNTGGPTAEAVKIRDAVRIGELRGPRIFTAGAIIDQSSFPGLCAEVRTEAEVRAEVNRQADAGVDYIKVYSTLPPPLVKAAIDEAHRRGIRIIGHLMFTSWTEAANMGIDGLVHGIPLSPSLLPPEKRTAFIQGIQGTQFMYQWFQYMDPASPEITDMVKALVANHVNIDPTLVAFDLMVRGDDPAVTQDPELALVPMSLVDNWRNVFTLSMGWSTADYQEARAVWPSVLKFVKQLYDAGVLLTAGTDLANPWVIPGVSFHQELKLLTDTGIPPLEVLSIATRNGAQSLGILSDVGTVQAGKRADLVLLNADPVTKITNTREIAWTMMGGEVLRDEPPVGTPVKRIKK